MNDRKQTVAEVVASANAARENLALLERELQEDIDAIDFNAFKEKRGLTPDEVARRKSFRATQSEVRENFKVLAFVTAQRLDQATEVAQLARQMAIINAGLEDDLDRLKAIVRYAKIAAKVADTTAKVAEKLAKAAAKALV